MALTMSFTDSMKDKAARLIPTPFTDLVAEATSELGLVPDYDKIIFLCDSANAKEEHAVDLVRAVRRRLDNSSAKVRFFTISLIEALIKNCGVPVHKEIAETKGLLFDLVGCATKTPSADGEADAKKAALQLILNMSIWFGAVGAPHIGTVKPLTTLVDAVRAQGVTFDGLEPDLTVSIRTDVAPPQRQAAQRQQHTGSATRRANRAQRHAHIAGQQRQQRSDSQYPFEGQTVTAVPVIIPNDEELSGMLDACMLLGECMNTAEAEGSMVLGNELLANLGTQVRRDHRKLSRLISSGAEMPSMDMMLTVCDSQVAVLQRVAEAARNEGSQHAIPEELLVPEEVAAQQANYPPAPGYAPTGQDPSQVPPQPVQERQQRQEAEIIIGSPSHPSDNNNTAQMQTGSIPMGAPLQPAAPAPAPAPQAAQPAQPSPASGYRAAMDIDDVPPPQQQQPVQAAPAAPPAPAPAPAPTLDELFGAVAVEQQQPPAQPAPAPAPAPQQEAAPSPSPPAPAPNAAFPAPAQSMNPTTEVPTDFTKTDEPPAPAAQTGSLNNDEANNGGDDFDAFLNNRLAGN